MSSKTAYLLVIIGFLIGIVLVANFLFEGKAPDRSNFSNDSPAAEAMGTQCESWRGCLDVCDLDVSTCIDKNGWSEYTCFQQGLRCYEACDVSYPECAPPLMTGRRISLALE